MDEPGPNGERLPAGGRDGRSHSGGIGLSVVLLHFGGANPTSRALVLGGMVNQFQPVDLHIRQGIGSTY